MSSNDNVTTKDIELPDGYVLRVTSSTDGAGGGFGAACTVVPVDKAGAGAGGSSDHKTTSNVGVSSNWGASHIDNEGPLPVGFPSGCGASHVDTQQGFSSANLEQSSAEQSKE